MAFMSVTQTVTLNHGTNKKSMEKHIMYNFLIHSFLSQIKFMMFLNFQEKTVVTQ